MHDCRSLIRLAAIHRVQVGSHSPSVSICSPTSSLPLSARMASRHRTLLCQCIAASVSSSSIFIFIFRSQTATASVSQPTVNSCVRNTELPLVQGKQHGKSIKCWLNSTRSVVACGLSCCPHTCPTNLPCRAPWWLVLHRAPSTPLESQPRSPVTTGAHRFVFWRITIDRPRTADRLKLDRSVPTQLQANANLADWKLSSPEI